MAFKGGGMEWISGLVGGLARFVSNYHPDSTSAVDGLFVVWSCIPSLILHYAFEHYSFLEQRCVGEHPRFRFALTVSLLTLFLG